MTGVLELNTENTWHPVKAHKEPWHYTCLDSEEIYKKDNGHSMEVVEENADTYAEGSKIESDQAENIS